ncbi:uncharacterized oxidoreductase YjmC-like [Ischnura elegans]|uniref:uncharacterized oxidoreductase YjmC-like n=1 Tax=Ischnura elegans TaxID=197161 RepID=UPI001ED8BE5B|nr:uncharacterized oxidoreductase YjmC-like [Ischnura elegans]
MAAKKYFTPLQEVYRFVTEAMMAAGTPELYAQNMAEVLVSADRRGHTSHGLNRLGIYVAEVLNGTTDPCTTPTIIQDKGAVALVDGNNGLGPVVGNICMDLAMEKAKQMGVGWIAARGSNHYGMAGWYSMRAADKGFVGITCSNSSPLAVPHRGKKAVLGTNPISVAAPGNNDSFVLDMATTAVSLGKIDIQRAENAKIPAGWAQDFEGKETTNSDTAMIAGCLIPLGRTEETSGYKGTGLALMVEILCGILSGANYGPFIKKLKSTTGPANLGQSFIALDPSAFAPHFEDRLSHLLEVIRTSQPVDPTKPILVAGDPERIHMSQVTCRGGLLYHHGLIRSLLKLAMDLQINPLQCKPLSSC